jgi:hypothetical protein
VFLGTLADQCRALPGDELTSLDRVLERKLYDIDRADIQAVSDRSLGAARRIEQLLGSDAWDVQLGDLCAHQAFFSHLAELHRILVSRRLSASWGYARIR